MKSVNNLNWQKSFFVVTIVIGLMVPSLVQAQEKTMWSRDADVDALLVEEGGLGGLLPPTGAALPAVGSLANPSTVLTKAPIDADFSVSVLPTTGDSRDDKRAEVFQFEGKVRVKKKGTEYWTPVYKRMILEEGDEVLTYKSSFLSVRYDRNYLNLIHIEENTRAIFRSIEPTDIFLEKGTLFHYLDAMMKGRTYQVSTGTTTLGVRGTHLVNSFNPLNQQSIVTTIPDDKEHVSEVEVKCGSNSGSSVSEGNQVTHSGGGCTQQDGQADPGTVQKAQDNFSKMADSDPEFNEIREQGQNADQGKPAPPTSGGLFGLGSLNAAGPGIVGGDEDPFDPTIDSNAADVGGAPAQSSPFDSPFFDDEGPFGDDDGGKGDDGCKGEEGGCDDY